MKRALVAMLCALFVLPFSAPASAAGTEVEQVLLDVTSMFGAGDDGPHESVGRVFHLADAEVARECSVLTAGNPPQLAWAILLVRQPQLC